MKRLIAIFLTACLVSCYIFPFLFTFFPAQNTKNMLGVLGVVLYVLDSLRDRKMISAHRGMIWVFIAALAVSLVSYFAMVFNNTMDDTYVSYIFTLVIWLSAAYVCIRAIKAVHGYASASLIIQYISFVAVLQCVFALLLDSVPAFENFVTSWCVDARYASSKGGRLYGIGCMLDVAGVRFSGILVMLAYWCYEAARDKERKKLRWGLICYCFIVVVGNMIARTTTVGAVVGIGIWLLLTFVSLLGLKSGIAPLWRSFVLVVTVVAAVFTFLYQTDAKTHENLRFGFEGFFSLAEKGHWETNSNNELKEMVVWPDNTSTWIFGDGYMADPTAIEPYLQSLGIAGDYVYMGTDIGYCRFIFYFGIIGLAIFIIYFAVVAGACSARAPSKKVAFFFLFVINLIVWAKVTTDAFAVMAIFLLADVEMDEGTETEDDLEIVEG